MARPVSFILSAASAVFALALPASADVQTLSADAAHTLVQRGELILLDVRTPSEWAMTGMPRDSVGANVKDVDFLAQARGAVLGDLDYPVAVICRAGNRSKAWPGWKGLVTAGSSAVCRRTSSCRRIADP